MRIIVTGGNGFIGRHVVKELYCRGVEVISFDIVPIREYLPGVQYVNGSIMDKNTLWKYIKQCDGVFHLAAILGVENARKKLLKCMSINIQGTVNVLEACVMCQNPYVLFTSSSEIFGDLNHEKIKEENPTNPKSGYAVSKLAGEQYVKGFHKEFGINYNIVRLFNVYGQGQVAEFVIPKFVKMAVNNIEPTIYGKGDQVRSFCNIKDAARAICDIGINRLYRNDIFNIGNDFEPVAISDLAKKITKKTNPDLAFKYVPFAKSDRKSTREIFYRVPDITKLKNAINFQPIISLDQGIDELLIDHENIPDSWNSLETTIKREEVI